MPDRPMHSQTNTHPGQVAFLASVVSEPFKVVQQKDFRGLDESTYLSRAFSDQGVRLRLRKEPRAFGLVLNLTYYGSLLTLSSSQKRGYNDLGEGGNQESSRKHEGDFRNDYQDDPVSPDSKRHRRNGEYTTSFSHIPQRDLYSSHPGSLAVRPPNVTEGYPSPSANLYGADFPGLFAPMSNMQNLPFSTGNSGFPSGNNGVGSLSSYHYPDFQTDFAAPTTLGRPKSRYQESVDSQVEQLTKTDSVPDTLQHY